MIDPLGGEPRDLDEGRQISFVVTPTGVRVAYATVGRGPALVVPAAWIGHLEIAWQDPAMRAFYAPIAACRTVVAYDKPGCGLSDPRPAPQTLDSDLEVLRAVIDHLKLGRAAYYGDPLFPDCFAGGPARAPADGLRVFPGPVSRRSVLPAGTPVLLGQMTARLSARPRIGTECRMEVLAAARTLWVTAARTAGGSG